MQSISSSILVPAGNEFGGINVNRNFERFITERIGADRIKAFQEEGRKNSASWNALVYLEFEKEKIAFGGHAYSNSSGHEHLSLKIDARLCHLFKTAFPCNYTRNQDVFFAQDDQVLHIPHSIVEKEFFCPVANGAMQCIRAALQQINDRVNKVYLVGGFGGYIYNYLSAQLKDQHTCTQLQTTQRLTRSAQQQTGSAQQLTRCIDVIEPKESNLAVVRGAVRFGLNSLVIASRKADATYGIITSVPFDPKIHDKSHRFKDSRNQWYKADRMSRAKLQEKYPTACRFRKTDGNIAAIDFRTTFCCLAFTVDSSTAADNLSSVEINIMPLNKVYPRVPTAILLKEKPGSRCNGDSTISKTCDFEVVEFGYDAVTKHCQLKPTEQSKFLYFECFKMTLQQDEVCIKIYSSFQLF